MALKFAFVMDPLESVHQDKDTTFVFMLESLARAHEIFHLGLRGLFAHGHQAFAWVRRCEVMRATPHYRFLDEGAQYPLEAFDAIFMRKDPPADAAYLFATMLLSFASRSGRVLATTGRVGTSALQSTVALGASGK